MTGSGYCVLPGGDVIVALTLPRPPCGPLGGTTGAGRGADDASVRVLVRAKNRARALTRLRNLGLRAVYLRGNIAPPTPDEITAVLHHPEGLLWRAAPDDPYELWHPIAALLRPQGILGAEPGARAA
ncbi:hypothetical protein ABZV64_01610 [Streptomyces sp. NPDC004959]|uniref:hypothetical protein n=1 Tax=unclassified Streptomyces TaxID=2593676 RepID=UPI00339FA1A6